MKHILLSVALLAPTLCFTEKADVTVANLVRAETDHMIRANMAAFGFGVAEFFHLLQPIGNTPPAEAEEKFCEQSEEFDKIA